MKIDPEELTRVVIEGRDVAAQLARLGRPMAGAVVNVLCDVALAWEAHEAPPEVVGSLEVAPPAPEPEEQKHRHVWSTDDAGVTRCIEVPGCTAKPRQKKAAPAEGGGS